MARLVRTTISQDLSIYIVFSHLDSYFTPIAALLFLLKTVHVHRLDGVCSSETFY